jgi:nucleotide-binding universal stress UspA family protein
MFEGLPAEVILENSSGFDLIVIGKGPSKSTWNLFSKNTVRRVIQGSECQVLVVHQHTGSLDRELASQAKVAT